MVKKVISIDLDGVLNNYSGVYREDEISSIKSGAKEFLERLSKNFLIHIFTVRDKNRVKEWLFKNKIDHLVYDVSPSKNNFASVIVDDRALNFKGNYDDIYEKIIKFKPYWKK